MLPQRQSATLAHFDSNLQFVPYERHQVVTLLLLDFLSNQFVPYASESGSTQPPVRSIVQIAEHQRVLNDVIKVAALTLS